MARRNSGAASRYGTMYLKAVPPYLGQLGVHSNNDNGHKLFERNACGHRAAEKASTGGLLHCLVLSNSSLQGASRTGQALGYFNIRMEQQARMTGNHPRPGTCGAHQWSCSTAADTTWMQLSSICYAYHSLDSRSPRPTMSLHGPQHVGVLVQAPAFGVQWRLKALKLQSKSTRLFS